LTVDEHRRTAAAWHTGPSSTLHAYAINGTVAGGLAGEIEDRLAYVEWSPVGAGFDRVGEHQRLRALLHHVEAELAVQRAYEIGRQYGHRDAALWRDGLGDQTIVDATATARRVLRAIENDDVAVLDFAPGPEDIATPAEIAAQAGLPEPGADDIEAYKRWDGAHLKVCGAYVASFVDAFWDAVATACRHQLATVPFIRRVGTVGVAGARSGERATPKGWIAQPIGRWDGVDSELVYDPRRHEIDVVSSERVSATSAAKWNVLESSGSTTVWVRDRVAVARSALDRHDSRAALIETAQPGPAQEPPGPQVEL
jgi:hypothetical protein